MLSNITSKKVLKKAPNNPIAQNNPFKTGIFFIPLSIGGGFLSNTNAGVVSEKQFEEDFDLFSFTEKIAEGQGDFQVNWRGALELKEGLFDKVYIGENQGTLNLYCDLTYKVGYYGFGYQTNYDLDFKIEQEASFNDFTSITDDDEITLLIKPDDLIGVIDFKRYRFYAFPFVFGHKVFYVSSCKTNINPNDSDKIVSYEVVFTNISNKLQKSGQSIEQYFHHNMAGNGYAWPTLDKENKRVLLDVDKLNTIGVNVIQEETYNACLQNNTAFVGWEIFEGNIDDANAYAFSGDITKIVDNRDGTYTQRIYAPKLIFPYNFTSAEPTILTKRALPESDLAIINKVNFSEDNYEEWKKYWESYFSGDFSVKYSGEMEWGFRNNIYSYQKLNDTIQGLRLIFKGVANNYCKETIDTQVDTLTWADANFYNYLTNKDVFTLPFSFTNHILNQPKQWPIIGSIWDALTGGFPWGWDEQNRVISNNRDMCFLTSSTMLDISKKDWNTSSGQQNDKAFINTWYAKDSDDRFNANNRTLAVKYNLTSNFKDTNLDKKYSRYDTSILGQSFYWNGQYKDGCKVFTYINDDKSNYAIDGTQRLIKKNEQTQYRKQKFIICGISNQNCFGDSQKFTMFNGYKPLWTNTFITNSTFRNTSRDWTNWYYTNPLNNLILNGNPIDYPIVENKQGSIESIISYNVNKEIFEWVRTNTIQEELKGDEVKTYRNSVFDIGWNNNIIGGNNAQLNLTDRIDNVSFTQHYTFDIKKYDTKKKLMDYLAKRIEQKGIMLMFRHTLKCPYGYKYNVAFRDIPPIVPNTEFNDVFTLNLLGATGSGTDVEGEYINTAKDLKMLSETIDTNLFNDNRLPFDKVNDYWLMKITSTLKGGNPWNPSHNGYIKIYFDNFDNLTGDVDLRFKFVNFYVVNTFDFWANSKSESVGTFDNSKADTITYFGKVAPSNFMLSLWNNAQLPWINVVKITNRLKFDLVKFEIL